MSHLPDPKRNLHRELSVALIVLGCMTGLGVGATPITQQNPPLLQIDSPVAGTIVNPGQTITVSVSSPATASFSGVAVIAEDPIPESDTQGSIPGQFSITIPVADCAVWPDVVVPIAVSMCGPASTSVVEILRPPVVMIHGLWSDWRAWNNFTPLVSGPGTVDPRFYIGRVNYDRAVVPKITATDPPYSQSQMQDIHQNSLGFIYNAPLVLGDVESWIDGFKDGNNPLGIPAAAVQADIIAHSMGGDIARTFVLQPTFLAPQTFGSGSIHKLITIDTPHLGSPLAADLGSPGEKSGCAATLLALADYYVLNSVVVGGGILTFPGAIADLSPGSFALSQIANQNQHLIPTALIAGVEHNFLAPGAVALFCSAFDSLAQADTSDAAWSSIVFNNQSSDAIVPTTSQLDGLSASPGLIFSGVIHSPAIEPSLGFGPPSVLDRDAATGIPSTVIKLLNTPITTSSFNLLNP